MNVRGNNKNNNCGIYTCGEIKETIKESDENNKKTTQGRKTIRTTKSKTLKLGNRLSVCMQLWKDDLQCRQILQKGDMCGQKGNG